MLNISVGKKINPDPTPLKMPPVDPFHPEVYAAYDPRITKIGDEYIILYASDMGQNCVRLGVLKTKDSQTFERISTASDLGNRTGALFPKNLMIYISGLTDLLGTSLNLALCG